MEAKHYVLTEAEHTQELEASTRTIVDPDGKKQPTTQTIPAVFQPIDKDALTYEQRTEAMVMAGLDKYVGGVAFGQLTKAWRGHRAGSFAIRHLNSSGYHVHVFDAPVPETAIAVDVDLAELQAQEEIAKLEAEREAQRKKDAAANDNKEGAPTPAPVEPPAA